MAVEKSRHYLQSLLKELTVPLEYGTVTNRHIPDGEMRGLVVCVQDLPGNIGVYKNVAQIICFLSERYSFEYIFIGAAFGECSVMNFEGLSRRKTRRLARSLLEKGAMNGAEYAIAMRPDLELELWGIDEPVLYLKNAGQVRDMLEIKDVISNRIVHGRSDLLRIALPMLNTNLGDFLRIDQRYAEVRQTITQQEYLRHLFAYARLLGVPDLPSRAVSSRSEPLSRIGNWCAQVFRLNREEYPVLRATEKEISHLRKSVLRLLCRTAIDYSVVRAMQHFERALLAFRIELTAADALEFLSLRPEDVRASISEAVSLVNDGLDRYGAASDTARLDLSDTMTYILERWPTPEEYSRTATERSDFMSERLAAEITKRGLDRAIFNEGGFHTEYCSENLLVRHRIGSVTITPTVKSLKNSIFVDEMFAAEELKEKGLKSELREHWGA